MPLKLFNKTRLHLSVLIALLLVFGISLLASATVLAAADPTDPHVFSLQWGVNQ